MKRWRGGWLSVGLCLLACGGSDKTSNQGGAAGTSSGPLPMQTVATCEYLRADNCYKRSLARAATCLGSADKGTLSADRKLCDYGNGRRTDIGVPLFNPSSGNAGYLWDLKLTVGGNVCAHAVEGTGSDFDFSLATELGTFQQSMKDQTLRVVCPDQSSFEMPVANVYDCLDGLPAVSGSVSFDSASAWLEAPSVAQRAQLLRCDVPI